MQMWSCGLSCRTNCTNLLASFHILSRTYTNTAVVHIFCHQTVPVIDNYPVTKGQFRALLLYPAMITRPAAAAYVGVPVGAA